MVLICQRQGKNYLEQFTSLGVGHVTEVESVIRYFYWIYEQRSMKNPYTRWACKYWRARTMTIVVARATGAIWMGWITTAATPAVPIMTKWWRRNGRLVLVMLLNASWWTGSGGRWKIHGTVVSRLIGRVVYHRCQSSSFLLVPPANNMSDITLSQQKMQEVIAVFR